MLRVTGIPVDKWNALVSAIETLELKLHEDIEKQPKSEWDAPWNEECTCPECRPIRRVVAALREIQGDEED